MAALYGFDFPRGDYTHMTLVAIEGRMKMPQPKESGLPSAGEMFGTSPGVVR